MNKRTNRLATGLGVITLSWSGIALSQEATQAEPAAPQVTEEAVPAAEAPEDAEVKSGVENTAEAAPAEATPAEATPAEATPAEAAPAEAAPDPVESVAVEAPVLPPEPTEPTSYIDPQLNVGVGLRVSYGLDTDVPGENFGHTAGTNVRPYFMGSVSKHIKFEANLDSNVQIAGGDPVANIRVLDAVLKLEFHDLVNFWAGRFLPPSDRANLSGPYFQNSWVYPVQANLFPAIYAGRQNGAAYWGQVGGGVFKWQLGAFDATGGDNPLFAGRLVLNLLDPEGGYYNSSTYYGSKDILAIGGTIQYQKGGDTVTGTGIDGAALEVDLLFEKELDGSGTLTAEGAYYNFTNTDQGQSATGLLSYLLPGKQGVGTLQPAARLQVMIPDAGDTYTTIDGSLNYIVDGHNARFTLNYQHIEGHDGIAADNQFTLGGQLQVF